MKAYAQYQHWFPITPKDQFTIRGELGTTFAVSREGIPEDFLYRAGGSRSNRGYAYQSLGPREGDAVVGGRFLMTGTAEYIHWLNDRWGLAYQSVDSRSAPSPLAEPPWASSTRSAAEPSDRR